MPVLPGYRQWHPADPRTLLALSEDGCERWQVLGEVSLAPHKGNAITGAVLLWLLLENRVLLEGLRAEAEQAR